MKLSKELVKGSTPMLILGVIAQEDMYGYKIIKELEKQSDSVFVLKEGTLYPILHALEKEDYLESYWDHSTGERKRKFYHITKKGKQYLKSKTEEWQLFSKSVTKVLDFSTT